MRSVEAALNRLLPMESQPREMQALPSGVLCLVLWWVMLVAVWGACCVAAPLFAPQRA